ncbi:MAG: sulfite exporter TauE/SafE family protein [Armatimonadetes bacterium]|nr:sulfite exporter TauE/SafE family protein [Armatimonadota bacterium]
MDLLGNFLTSLATMLKNQIQHSIFLAYPIAFLAGILASLTPCVYPVIPIIVGYIGGQKQKSKLKAFSLSLFYVLGMAITYALLGAFAALSGTLFGSIQTNPMVYFIVGNIIVLFGISMLDAFSLPIPSFFIKDINDIRKRKGSFLSAVSMGVASGFISAPCTAAVVGVILAYVASRQNLFFGLSLLFTFALGMGILLILVGTFTGVLSALPKSGKWMLIVQRAFGWVMILLGEFFLIQGGKLML